MSRSTAWSQIHQEQNPQRPGLSAAEMDSWFPFLWVKEKGVPLFEDKFHITCKRKVFQAKLRVNEMVKFLNVSWITSLWFSEPSIDFPQLYPMGSVLHLLHCPPSSVCNFPPQQPAHNRHQKTGQPGPSPDHHRIW